MKNDNEILKIFNELFKTNFHSLDIDRSQIPQWDSMKHAELIIKLQRHFAISFKTKDIIATKNLLEIKALVSSRD